ncbi:dye-decolorizing heme-containing peroxidase [Marasmius sp. AFHP31]|nr:dye-decolorizing heme-containing peroxidase [Marasmius sp. AFHP31]
MRLSLVLCIFTLSAFAYPNVEDLYSRQDDAGPLLIDPAGQPSLPSPQQAERAAARLGLDLDNIQGDILVGMKKRKELFFFFQIRNKALFKSSLKNLRPLITTTKQLLNAKSNSGSAVNIAFSQTGLNFLGVSDDLKDDAFKAGQASDANNLGDPGTKNWVDAFKGNKIHGVLLVAADNNLRLLAQLAKCKLALGLSVSELYTLQGASRPGDQEGHEHFGYMDGISQPGINGFTDKPLPGQQMLDPGFFLLGEKGDSTQRPAWAKDGSFLAFRQLRQLVPEFSQFVTENALKVPGLSVQENTDLFGARMVGRWKSGAPIDLAPLRDDPVLAKDPMRNNDFTFEHPGADILTNQTNCPFSAHVRKTRPRADFDPENTENHIMRAGIPYGPEVTALERSQKKSSDSQLLERGLAFVAYQSNIGAGFQFIQRNWVDNADFFFGKSTPPGVDPIIGSTNGGKANIDNTRVVSGLNPMNSSSTVTIKKDFVISRGGEYFFTPSLAALNDPIGK